MVEGDIGLAVKLTDTMEWGFEDEDFKFMMKLEPDGCFVAKENTKFVGLTTSISLESLGWIGNVIVDSDYRDLGIGSALMQYTIRYLQSRDVKTIGLYSYVDTIPFYEALGFKRDKAFLYLVGSGVNCGETKPVRPMGVEDFKKAVELDKRCIGVSREKLLRGVFTKSRNLCYTAYAGNDLVGFVMARKSSHAVEVGPIVCKTGAEAEALDFLRVLLKKFIGFNFYLGVPEDKFPLLSQLKVLKIHEKFKVVRMYRGRLLHDKDCVFAMESLERG